MPPLFYHRIITPAGVPNEIRIINLGHCILRLINITDLTDTALVSCAICKRNDVLGTTETLSIFQRQQQIAAAFDIGWEGEIELGADQVLQVIFEDTPGVVVTVGDLLYVTVGYIPIV